MSVFALTEEYIDTVQDNARMSPKGYVIPKSCLDPRDLTELKDSLTVSPKESFGMKKMGNGAKSCPVVIYRENEHKIYIPRFFGTKRYGIPVNWDLDDGDNIDVPFVKSIRDYQEHIVTTYLNYVQNEDEIGNGGILEVPCGRGKTVMALNISARLKKKTFILVHKEFLMNQWIERIHEFMPSARVGCIQGKRFEVDNCDIVIGMIQTLYDKPYPSGTFSSFGLTIIDEVHRIGSEEFSKTLLKVVTPYMLGISATVDRKDGLTELIHMFIGDKIYSEERETEDGVEVRAVQYEFFADEEYNEVEHDFRGNVKFSTMINKISDFGPRRHFIVRILQDLMKENSEKQIMVLSHKRDLLEYLRLEIERLDFASCGLYVGGMKPAALQETEGKEVVLATYAMAAEALDIKTLNTLVMVSPKTDIVQSVGRILRTKGDGKIIVDIVDSHDVFQNQWRKRRAYYNSCDYKVKMCKSCEYKGMKNETTEWRIVGNKKKKTNDGVFGGKCMIKV